MDGKFKATLVKL